jgi:isopentenyl diphosphate isomerase/L-lactate dehydrogenase-like FMN-dependent dehydrogenase
MTWDFVKKLQEATKAKIVLKGIMTPEDAKLAVAAGGDGILVSNHGGRAAKASIRAICRASGTRRPARRSRCFCR